MSEGNGEACNCGTMTTKDQNGNTITVRVPSGNCPVHGSS